MTHPAPITRAAIAARYSSDRQHERSLEDQIRLCRGHAERQGWAVLDEWICKDAAKSGTTTAGRDGFHRLLAGARARRFDVVLVDDLGRLTREADVTVSVFKDLQRLKIRLIGVSDGFDSVRPGAKIEAMFRGLINELYVDDLASKTHRGLTGQFLRGFNPGGRLYGYRTDPVFLPGADPRDPRTKPEGYSMRIEPAETDVVRRIFRMYAVERVAVNEIVRRLNAERIPAPGHRGKRRCTPGWSHSAVLARIDNEAYIGNLVWNRRDWVKDREADKRTYTVRPDSEWVRRNEPSLAIIGKDEWAAAQARRASARKLFPGFRTGMVEGGYVPGKPRRHLLSGLLRCGVCGGVMMIAGGKGDSRSYKCASNRKGSEFCANSMSVSKAKIERSVFGSLQKQLQREDLVRRMMARISARLRETAPKDDAEGNALEEAARTAETGLNNLLALVTNGEAAPTRSTATFIAHQEAHLDEVRRRLAEVRARPKPADLIPTPAFVQKEVEVRQCPVARP
jgi:site-specific DNA recombinase